MGSPAQKVIAFTAKAKEEQRQKVQDVLNKMDNKKGANNLAREFDPSSVMKKHY